MVAIQLLCKVNASFGEGVLLIFLNIVCTLFGELQSPSGDVTVDVVACALELIRQKGEMADV